MFQSMLSLCVTRGGALCLVALGMVGGTQILAGESWPAVTAASEAKIQSALDDHTSFEFIETPLQDVVEYLKKLHGIEIQFDRKAIEEVGIDSTIPVTRGLKAISLRSALRLMLRDMDLTYVVQDEVLLITTIKQSVAASKVRIYNVVKLLDGDDSAADLAKVLHYSMDMPAESDDKQPSRNVRRITAYQHLLIVRDTEEGHQEFAHLLAMLGIGLKEEHNRAEKAEKANLFGQGDPFGKARKSDGE